MKTQNPQKFQIFKLESSKLKNSLKISTGNQGVARRYIFDKNNKNYQLTFPNIIIK